MPTLRVWTGLDARIGVFKEDSNGVAVNLQDQEFWNLHQPDYDTPLFEYCYWQSFSIDAELDATRRLSPNRLYPRITTRAHTYTAKVTSFYVTKSDTMDLQDILNRQSRFTFIIANVAPERGWNDHSESTGNEQHFLRHAICKVNSIASSEGNNIQMADVTIWAEEFK